MDNNPIPTGPYPQRPANISTDSGKPSGGMKKFFIIFFTIFLVFLLSAAVLLFLKPNLSSLKFPSIPKIPSGAIPSGSKQSSAAESKETSVKKFASAEEFKEYLQTGNNNTGYSGLSMFSAGRSLDSVSMGIAPKATAEISLPQAGGGGPERVSETNTQVKGIDEPDIIKTDGKNIYFSSGSVGVMPVMERSIGKGAAYLPPYSGKTRVISAFPAADIAVKSNIDKTGDLLLYKDTLTLFSGQQIFGYNIKDPGNPTQKWKIDLDQNTYLTASRLYQGKIYFITQTSINIGNPCPIVPLRINEAGMSIPCTSIYHPEVGIPVDVTYTASVLDPATGKVENNISFVSSAGNSTVYMSGNAIYIAYSYNKDLSGLMYNFFQEKGKDLIPDTILQKLNNLQKLDISAQAKQTELNVIIANYQNTLSADEKLKFNNEMTNRMKDYSKTHLRDFEKTGITKIKTESLAVAATGSVPGHLLNQFSMDEYQDNLRVAITASGTLGLADSANDLYILDKDLKNVGSVLNMGVGERIYSARFIEDKGYIVTFKQTDPFYVLDLSDPKNPQLKGELKIPGYSSYLDPIAKNRVLGLGKEGQKVKVSLFDVTSASNPLEADKYTLDEYWSESLDNHHAFLLDDKHQVFFLPGGQGGYVFSYEGDKLSLKKAVSDMQVKRAIYINDFMYILGENKVVILNENTWEAANQLTF